MRMKIDIPARLATVTIDEGETQIDLAGLDVFIQRAMSEPVGLTALEVIVSTSDMNSEELRKRGFTVKGSVSVDTVTKMVMRKTLSSPSFFDTPRSTYNPDLATQAPVLQPTPAEVAARSGLNASLEHHYSDSAINQRLAQIEAEAATRRAQRDSHKDVPLED
jgi:hypothetical protein